MKKRSTQKNKTRNFRKKNRGGTRGQPASNARTFRTFKASRTSKSSRASRATNMRGDRENVVDGRLWNDRWNEELNKIINPDLLVLMDLDNSNKRGEKYGLIYDIYYQAKNIIYKSQQSEKVDAKKNIIPLIDRFITLYANDYTGPKLNV